MSKGDAKDGFESEHQMVIEQIRDRIDPDSAEREAMQRVMSQLRNRITTEVESFPVSADVVQVGSTARRDMVSGRP